MDKLLWVELRFHTFAAVTGKHIAVRKTSFAAGFSCCITKVKPESNQASK